MSNFISSSPARGLRASPPVSKVTALPISASGLASSAPGPHVVQADQAGLLFGSLRDAGKRAHPQRPDGLLVEHRRGQRRIALRAVAGVLSQRRRSELVGRCVAEIAGAVLRVGHHGCAVHGRRDVVVGADDQAGDGGLVGRAGLVAGEAVGREQRAGDDRLDDLVADVVGQLPAERAGAALARPIVGHRRRYPRPLGVERRPRTEPDQEHAAAVVVGQREPLERAAGLAGVKQRSQLTPGQVVRDALVFEYSDDDRVGAGGERTVGARLDVHGRSRYQATALGQTPTTT